LRHPEIFSRGKLLTVPKGILLYGPPGTGKTMLAKALSKTSEAVFINVNIANILQKWWGESEKLVQATFSLAEKLQPSIIFIDEIDSLFRKRSEGDHEVSSRIKSLFMSLWDGLNTNPDARITVIGATNRPHTIDDAILRRLPQTFHIGLPDVDQRERILSIILKDEPIDPDFDVRRLAEETEGYSGSDLQALCETAARAPIRDHLRNARDILAPMRDLQLEDFLDAKEVVGATGETAQVYGAQQQSHSVPQQGRVVNFNFFPVSTVEPNA